MTLPIHKLPQDVQELLILSQAVNFTDSQSNTTSAFRKKVRKAIAQYAHSNDADVLEAIAKSYFPYIKYVVKRGTLASLHSYDVNDFVRFITKTKQVHVFNKSIEDSKTFSCIALLYVDFVIQGDKSHSENHIAELFTQWIDHNKFSEHLNLPVTLADAVDLVYGPGVWSLYGIDTPLGKLTPQYLYELDLELKVSKNQPSILGGISLPHDMM